MNTPSFWWGSCCLFFSFYVVSYVLFCLVLFFIFSHGVVSLFSIYEFDCPLLSFVPLLWERQLNISVVLCETDIHQCQPTHDVDRSYKEWFKLHRLQLLIHSYDKKLADYDFKQFGSSCVSHWNGISLFVFISMLATVQILFVKLVKSRLCCHKQQFLPLLMFCKIIRLISYYPNTIRACMKSLIVFKRD